MAIIDLTREEIKSGIESGTMLVVDVREPHEFAAGHIPGSVSMPLSSFHPADLPDAEGQQIVFSCAAGVRSRNALLMAQAAGLTLDAHYAGGFKDWAMAGEDIAIED
jgi:rhodanese-related sulfurtransferase